MTTVATDTVRSTGDLLLDATLRLFKALPVLAADDRPADSALDARLMEATIASGFVFAPEVAARYDHNRLLNIINQLYGRRPEELNATFHKSFAKVRDASDARLIVEQLVHYMTTYGAEFFGVYDKDSVYIPAERLDAPQLDSGVRLVVIRGLTNDELKAELLQLLSGAALSEQTVKDAVQIAKFLDFCDDDLLDVRNKEVRVALYDHLCIVPVNPEEFLRLVVYKATGSALLIKSTAVITQLAQRDNRDLEPYFSKADYTQLAAVFYRYKPLFLALRTTPTLKTVVNSIRRLAPACHRPMPEDFLNSVTAKMSRLNGDLGFANELSDALRRANTFRKVRLAYALKFRTTSPESILYRIRNGKSWATEFGGANSRVAAAVYEIVLKAIVDDVHPNVAGKKVFIPNGLSYALPATEKQFTGNLPTGTCAQTADNLVVGVHWQNLPNYRVDLDLSISNADGKVGWDSYYRDRQHGIYFSGDVTDAPNGASEVFHIGAQARGSWLMNLNFYNLSYDYDTDAAPDVPFKIVVGHDTQRNINNNYTIDPNKIVALSNSSIDVRQKTLGVLVADDDGTRFYFAEADFQRGRSARRNNASEHARRYLVDYYINAISLNDVLVDAGAELVSSPDEADIDLSWEAVNRTTILSLLGS